MALVKVRNDADDGWIEIGGQVSILQSDEPPGSTFPGMLWLDTNAVGEGSQVIRIQDGDGDTMVQCEESADEDKVRIDTEGDEVAIFESLGNTQPLQPAFQVMLSETQYVTVLDSDQDIVFETEVFDIGENFNTGTYTFTAPVTGKYDLSLVLRLGDLDNNAQYVMWKIITSNRYYTGLIDPNYNADLNFYPVCFNVLCDMDENDTAYCTIRQNLGNNSLFLQTAGITVFSGHLAC
jgi:hypothetical protein